LHESGHLLTLNDSQVLLIDPSEKSGVTYYTAEGQTLPGSYLNLFVKKFWTESMLAESKKISLITDQEKKDEAVSGFYGRYPGQFVTEYAATEPEEDIAETWSCFILNPKPSGKNVSEKKILFFYDFPELTAMRDSIKKSAGL
jgi:hypothetical protein